MIVSLGSSCSVAYQLQKLEKRDVAYPFDWIRTDKLEYITLSIIDGFKQFMDIDKINESNKFSVFDPEVEVFPNNNKLSNKSIIMKNKYNMKFYHDFNEDVDIEVIKEKYKRRIQRFIYLIIKSKYISFVRDEIKANNIDIKQIEEFLSSIRNINPSIDIKFILIIHNPKNKNLDILKYQDVSVKVINDTSPYGDWTRFNVSWSDVFGI